MDEQLDLPHAHDQSYWYFMYDNFFDHLVDMKPDNINIINGMTDDPEKVPSQALSVGVGTAFDSKAFMMRGDYSLSKDVFYILTYCISSPYEGMLAWVYTA